MPLSSSSIRTSTTSTSSPAMRSLAKSRHNVRFSFLAVQTAMNSEITSEWVNRTLTVVKLAIAS